MIRAAADPGGWQRARLWWAGPLAVVVLGGGAFALVIAQDLTPSPAVPERVVVATPSSTSGPTEKPGTEPTEEPGETVVQPTRPVVTESPDDHRSGGGDDGWHHERHSETDG